MLHNFKRLKVVKTKIATHKS